MGIIKTDTSFSVSESGRTPLYGEVATRIPELVTAEEAVHLGGLDYEVALQPLITESGIEVPSNRAVVRMDTQAVLGVVGDRYHTLQNRDALSILDSIVGAHKAVYECAGTLRGGAVAFAVLKLPKQIVLPGDDVVEKRVLFYTTHDGSGTTRAKVMPYRLYCANQINAILRGSTDGIAIRHTKNSANKLREAERFLGFSDKYFQDFEQQALAMVQTAFGEKQMKKFAERLLPTPKDAESASSQTLRARETLQNLFETGGGQANQPNIRGTVWAAFNSVTEYVDHERPTRVADQNLRAEKRVESVWFGSGGKLKQAAADLLVDFLDGKDNF